MIVTLYGPDSYRRTQKLHELLDTYRKKYEHLDLHSADLNESPDGWQEVRDFLKQPSMFVQSKVAVVRNATAVTAKAWVETLKSQLERDRVVVFAVLPKAPPKKFSFLTKPPAKSQEFVELKGPTLRAFVQNELSARKLSLAPEAERFFLAYLAAHDGRGWRTANELDKLSIATEARVSQPVSRADLRSLIPWTAREDMYQATRRLLSARDVSESIRTLEELLFREESADHVFNLLAYQAKGRTAVVLADYDVARKSGSLDYEECLLEFALGGAKR